MSSDDHSSKGGSKRGRPPGFGAYDLKPYVEAVLERLPGAFEWPRRKEPRSLMHLVVDEFVRLPSVADKHVPRSVDQVREILAGIQKLNKHHVEHLHHVLGMADYGLEAAGTWYEIVENQDRFFALDDFKNRLDAASDVPKDPVRAIRNLIDGTLPYIDFEEAEHPDRLLRPQFAKVLDDNEEPEQPQNGRVIEAESWIQVRFRTRVAGHVLLLSRRLPDPKRNLKERLVVLNDVPQLGLPRSAVYAEREQVFSRPIQVTKIESDEVVICVNWPAGLDVRPFDKDLFQDAGRRDKDPVMTVAAAMRRTVGQSDMQRVHAGLQTMHIRKRPQNVT